MSTGPLVTALMVNRNNGRFLGEAIGSVVAQTHGDWELIVVENGSTDDSSAVLEDWMREEPRIRLIRLTSTVTIPVARNLGLAEAQGEYIGTIDSDDIWLPDRLGRQLEVMNRAGNARMGVCGSNAWLMDQAGQVTGLKTFPATHDECVRALWRRNPFCHSATLIRRACFGACGPYDETFDVAQDLELWFRIGRRFGFHNVAEPLVQYRVWRGNVTARRHRLVIRHTLRARRLGWTQYGYRIGFGERFALAGTWLAQWLPPGVAMAIFDGWVLGRARPVVGEFQGSNQISNGSGLRHIGELHNGGHGGTGADHHMRDQQVGTGSTRSLTSTVPKTRSMGTGTEPVPTEMRRPCGNAHRVEVVRIEIVKRTHAE